MVLRRLSFIILATMTGIHHFVPRVVTLGSGLRKTRHHFHPASAGAVMQYRNTHQNAHATAVAHQAGLDMPRVHPIRILPLTDYTSNSDMNRPR